MKSIDPVRMSRDAILTELGELLSAGFQRHISSSMRPSAEGLNGEKPLDVLADVEASCGEPKEIQT